jgi:hypothetical protein
VTGTAKLASTAVLFALALGLLAITAATHSAIPLFFMWAPLLSVPWVLSRPEPAPQLDDEDGGDSEPNEVRG